MVMEVINELKEFDSLHNKWETIGVNRCDKEFETSMHSDEYDYINFEGCITRLSRKDKGDGNYIDEDYSVFV